MRRATSARRRAGVPCRRASAPVTRAQAGFTLLELLVASALLAVLAVIGWRGLEAVLSSRDRIVERSDALQAMSVTFAQLDEDLRRSWPVRLLDLPVPPLAFRGSGATPVLELLREGGGASDASRIERIAYRLRDGRFERGFGPLLAVPGAASGDPAGMGGIGAAGGSGTAAGFDDGAGAAFGGVAAASGALPLSSAPLVWQPLLAGVVQVRYRGWVVQRGWIDAPTLAAMQSTAQAAAVPGGASAAAQAAAAAARASADARQVVGVEVEIVRANGERYVRVFPRQD